MTEILKYKGKKIKVDKKDVPILIEKLREMIKVYCVGMTSKVFEKNTDKLAGFCGFHDFDGFLQSWDLRARICQVAEAMHTTVFALKTRHGYHIVSLEVFSAEQRRQWKNMMREVFPSNYIMNKGKGFEVLRITQKGPDNPTPKYDTMYSYPSNKPWSSSHLNIYLQKKIIPKEIVETVKPKIVETSAILCYYSTGEYK